MDERATLEELERVREAIERYKERRKAAGEEFEQFVRAFKAPHDTPAPPRAAPHTPAADVEPPAPSIQTADRRDVEPPALPIPDPAPIADPARVGRPTRPTTSVVIGVTVAALAGAGLLIWSLLPRAPAAPATSIEIPVAAPKPQPPPATEAAVATELSTVRAVWVRVVADGKRVVERELPPNARVPLKAEKTIVIRTGDAGAIRLIVRGQDRGFLGRAGEVVTRTFDVPPRQAR